MSNIIDRRKNNKGKSSPNRQRFIKRVEHQIKRALPGIIKDGNIKDLTSDGGTVKVPIKKINEPNFNYDYDTGTKESVRPGNDVFNQGDRVKKPKKGGGQGGSASKDGDGSDDFTVVISKEEFMKYFFEDLELPNMTKKYLESVKDFKNKRAGYTKNSTPSRLNVGTSFKESMARRIGVQASISRLIEEIEKELEKSIDDKRRLELEELLEKYKKQLQTIPFLEDIDLRYNNFEQVPVETTSAVMFCIMDVSGSMGYDEKDIAKRFFMFLYLFLMKSYDLIEIVYIRHHTISKEVSEEEFFNSKETGGTVVAPALLLMNDIIDERYSSQWNIYACQASDGDVWSSSDAIECRDILLDKILDKVQYMTYVEIGEKNKNGDLWSAYSNVVTGVDNMAIKKINSINQIWPAFKDLFKKKGIVNE